MIACVREEVEGSNSDVNLDDAADDGDDDQDDDDADAHGVKMVTIALVMTITRPTTAVILIRMLLCAGTTCWLPQTLASGSQLPRSLQFVPSNLR